MTTKDIESAFGISNFQRPRELKTDEEVQRHIKACIAMCGAFEEEFKDKKIEEFSTRLDKAIKISGLSQKELARKAKITEVSISRYVNGSREPNVETLRNICKALDVTADWLLGLEIKNGRLCE